MNIKITFDKTEFTSKEEAKRKDTRQRTAQRKDEVRTSTPEGTVWQSRRKKRRV